MEILKSKFSDALRAHKTLEDILKEPYSIIIRDATIQRFEYTFEAIWKYLKAYLKDTEGILCNSPKSCFRGAMTCRLLSVEETTEFLQMTDYRNLTSHTYLEDVAKQIFHKIDDFSMLMKKLLNKIKV